MRGDPAAAFVPIFVLGFSQAALVAYVAFVSVHAVYITPIRVGASVLAG